MEKLYEFNSHLTEFEAQVCSCTDYNGNFLVTLDRTAFYPEGGGQPCDKGRLAEANVMSVHEHDDVIYHLCDRAVYGAVHGSVDRKRRFDLMSAHSGEHILSGLICARMHANNVGFHISDDITTIDFDTAPDIALLCEIECAANEIVRENKAVKISYPTSEELRGISYRSKKEIYGRVRLVEFPHADICACCGTHVKHTGEIGLIKILSVQNYKGGMRLTIVCGERAYNDYCQKHDIVSKLAVMNSAKPAQVLDGVSRLRDTISQLRSQSLEMQSELCALRAEKFASASNYALDFCSVCDPFALSEALLERAKLAAAFCGKDGSYRFCICSKAIDVRAMAKAINAGICGKGGGSKECISGTCTADKSQIEAFFEATF